MVDVVFFCGKCKVNTYTKYTDIHPMGCEDTFLFAKYFVAVLLPKCHELCLRPQNSGV